MNYKIILFLLWLGSPHLLGQEAPQEDIQILSKRTDRGIKLKILPTHPDIWLEGVKKGYHIFRKEHGSDSFLQISSRPILPASEPEWKKVKGGTEFYNAHRSTIEAVQFNPESLDISEKIRRWDKIENEFPFYFLMGVLSADFSRLSGLEFLDTTVKNGKSYIYKVQLGENTISNHHFVPANEMKLTPSTPMIQSADKMIEISWEHEIDGPIVAYQIQKSKDGSEFYNLGDDLIFYNHKNTPQDSSTTSRPNVIFKDDSLDANYVDYYYRIIGVDIWGEFTQPSEVSKARGKNLSAPRPAHNVSANADDTSGQIRIEWDYPVDEEIKGFYVLHSDKNIDGYTPIHEQILSPDQRSFIHSDRKAEADHFYKILAIDTSQNVSVSTATYAFISDIIPPDAPEQIEGTCDTSGIVRLQWTASEAKDLKGYLIYASHGSVGDFIKITPYVLKNNTFTDTLVLNDLHEERHYQVVAVDKNFNHSDPSEAIAIQLPDLNIPAAPVLKNISEFQDKIQLNWIKSPSSDVQSYIIQKKLNDRWENFDTIQHDVQTYSIDQQIAGSSSEWRVTALDDAANVGHPSLPRRFTKRERIVKKAGDLSATLQNNQVILEWKSNVGEQYKVYRMKVGSTLKMLSMTSNSDYIDTKINPNNTYLYYVVTQNSRGQRIQKSQTLEIKS